MSNYKILQLNYRFSLVSVILVLLVQLPIAHDAGQMPVWPVNDGRGQSKARTSINSCENRRVEIALNQETLPRTAGAIDSKAGASVSTRILWTVSRYIIGEKATWSEKEARKLLFKPLDMDKNSITFDGKTCRDVIFRKETVKTKEYLDKFFHTTPQALGIIDETAEVIKTNCSLPGFGEYLRLKDRRLVIHINGIFFFMEPALNY